MNPLFKRAARRAERSGLQEELLDRYFFSQLKTGKAQMESEK